MTGLTPSALEQKFERLRLSAARIEDANAVNAAAVQTLRDDFHNSARERSLLGRRLLDRSELVDDARDDRIERCEGPHRDSERINAPTQVSDLVADIARALGVHSVRDCEITIKINGDLVQIAHESSPLRSGPEVASSDVPATTVTEITDTAPFAGVGESAGARADVSGTSTAPALADEVAKLRIAQQRLAFEVRGIRRDVGRLCDSLAADLADLTGNGHDERPSMRVGPELESPEVPATTVEGPSDIPPSSDVGESAGAAPQSAPALTDSFPFAAYPPHPWARS